MPPHDVMAIPVTARLLSLPGSKIRGSGAWRSTIIQNESNIVSDTLPHINTSNLGYVVNFKVQIMGLWVVILVITYLYNLI